MAGGWKRSTGDVSTRANGMLAEVRPWHRSENADGVALWPSLVKRSADPASEPVGVEDMPDFKGQSWAHRAIETGVSPIADGWPAFSTVAPGPGATTDGGKWPGLSPHPDAGAASSAIFGPG